MNLNECFNILKQRSVSNVDDACPCCSKLSMEHDQDVCGNVNTNIFENGQLNIEDNKVMLDIINIFIRLHTDRVKV